MTKSSDCTSCMGSPVLVATEPSSIGLVHIAWGLLPFVGLTCQDRPIVELVHHHDHCRYPLFLSRPHVPLLNLLQMPCLWQWHFRDHRHLLRYHLVFIVVGLVSTIASITSDALLGAQLLAQWTWMGLHCFVTQRSHLCCRLMILNLRNHVLLRHLLLAYCFYEVKLIL